MDAGGYQFPDLLPPIVECTGMVDYL